MAFSVSVDVEQHRLIAILTGFASVSDVERFEVDLHQAITQLGVNKGRHQALYDISEGGVQSQDVVQALRALTRRAAPTSAFALVNASRLAGRQLGRIFKGVEAQAFESRSEAVLWLNRSLSGSTTTS